MNPASQEDCEILLLVTDNCSIARMTIDIDDETFEAYGDAKRHPKDDPDDGIGASLAVSRAMMSVAKQLQSHAYRLLQKNDPHARWAQYLGDPKVAPIWERMFAQATTSTANVHHPITPAEVTWTVLDDPQGA